MYNNSTKWTICLQNRSVLYVQYFTTLYRLKKRVKRLESTDYCTQTHKYKWSHHQKHTWNSVEGSVSRAHAYGKSTPSFLFLTSLLYGHERRSLRENHHPFNTDMVENRQTVALPLLCWETRQLYTQSDLYVDKKRKEKTTHNMSWSVWITDETCKRWKSRELTGERSSRTNAQS